MEFPTRKHNYCLRKFQRPRRSNIDCVAKWKVLLCCCANLSIYVYPITTVTQFNMQQISEPHMNELAATKFSLRSSNELQTDDYTTAGRITERIVRCCSSV